MTEEYLTNKSNKIDEFPINTATNFTPPNGRNNNFGQTCNNNVR